MSKNPYFVWNVDNIGKVELKTQDAFPILVTLVANSRAVQFFLRFGWFYSPWNRTLNWADSKEETLHTVTIPEAEAHKLMWGDDGQEEA